MNPPLFGPISPVTRTICETLRKWDFKTYPQCLIPWKPLNDTDENWLNLCKNWYTIEREYGPVSKESFGTKVLYWKFTLHHVASGEANTKAE